MKQTSLPSGRALGLAAVLAAAAPSVAVGEETLAPSANVVTVKFTHAGSAGDRHFDVNLAVGQTLQVVVQQTCSAFDIAIRGIVRERGAASGVSAQSGEPLPIEPERVVSTAHDDQYGGYVVSIERRRGTRPCVNDAELENRLLFISAQTLDWNVAFAGGFTVSGLRDPVFGVRPDAEGTSRIVEERDKRDFTALGIAAFAHLFHEKRPGLALSFGLGIREDNKSQYFVGAGYRFGDKATLVGGMVFGPQARLPNGVALNDEAKDANALASLGSRTGKGFFIGLSYAFIEVGDRFKKPFAGTGNGGGSQAAAEKPEEAAGSTCDIAFSVNGTSMADVSLEASPSDVTIAVKGDATCEWAVTKDAAATWLTLSAASVKPGGSVTLSAAGNEGAARKAVVAFTPQGGQAKQLQVVQKAKG